MKFNDMRHTTKYLFCWLAGFLVSSFWISLICLAVIQDSLISRITLFLIIGSPVIMAWVIFLIVIPLKSGYGDAQSRDYQDEEDDYYDIKKENN